MGNVIAAERRQAAIELSERLISDGSLHAALLQLLPDLVFVVGPDLSIVWMNQVAVDSVELIWGKSPETGDQITEYSIDECREELERNVDRALGGETLEVSQKMTHPNGEQLTFDVRYMPLHSNETIAGVIVSATDTTSFRSVFREQKVLERALNRLALGVTVASNDPDRDFPLTFVNDGFCNMTGYDRAELIGKNCRWLQADLEQPETLARLRELLNSGEAGGVVLTNRRKSGEIFYNRLEVSPVSDDEGRLVEYIGIQTDVTEEMEMQRGLNRAQRMESLGELAAGMAHDFNNALQIILQTAQVSLEETSESSQAHSDMGTIEHSARHARELVSSLLEFASEQTSTLETIDLGAVVGSLREMMMPLMKGSGTLTLEVAETPVLVLANRREIEQVVLNLVSNSADAIERGGSVTVGIRSEERGGDEVAIIEVRDDGNGMSREQANRAFEPFFTTKGDDGTGLGLSTSFGIIKSFGGSVTIDSEVRIGTTIRIRLPMR